MRHTDHKSITAAAAAALLTLIGAGIANAEGLRGSAPIDADAQPPALTEHLNDDKRQVRNYPEQPPVIPHSIRNYQVDLNFNKCLTCHARETAPAAGAPMVSISHFMDRDGQVLSDVSARRYFCTQCHVPQMASSPPVGNTFSDGN